jgi:hypothetical protein
MSTIFTRIMEIQDEVQDEILRKRNVVGVAVGYKESKGKITDEPAVVVMVETKHPLTALAVDDVVPTEVSGVRTDVYETGRFVAQQAPTDRFRPTIPAGCSIGHYTITAGTLGVIVRDRTTGERLILSNNHVLANSNAGVQGDPILQPAPADGGQNPADVVAHLERFISLSFLEDSTEPPGTKPPPDQPGTDPAGCLAALMGLSTLFGGRTGTLKSDQKITAAAAPAATMPAPTVATATTQPGKLAASNIVDCALAKPVDTAMFTDQILGIGVVRTHKNPELGMRVRKSGRTTGVTESVVTLVNATVDVGYGTDAQPLTARFTGQVICEPMSQGGDSGSLVVDMENNAVGLLFAGSGLATIFTPIEVVFNALNVELG